MSFISYIVIKLFILHVIKMIYYMILLILDIKCNVEYQLIYTEMINAIYLLFYTL